MPLYVNTNVSSLNAQRQLLQSGAELDQASERLASGRRINTAADDAAGLAISNRQTSQIRGLNQAIRNANDGISLIQTAEGALGESTNILQRMRELAIQSANGIYEDKDRATLDAEVQQLVAELDRIAESTAFNGQTILDGSLGEVTLQVGAQANQTIGFNITAVDADTLGMGSLSADVVGDEIDADATNLALDEQDILINGQAMGEIGTADTMNDILNQINENITGVTASSVVQIDATSIGTGVVGTAGIQFTVVGGDGLSTTYNVANTESLSELADEITKVTNGIISADIGDDGSLQVSAQGVRSIAFADADTGGGAGIAASTFQAQIILSSDNGDDITVERGATGTLMDLEHYGFREFTDAGYVRGVGMVVNSGGANEALDVGDLKINGVQIDVTDTSSLAAKIDAINDVSQQTGVVAGTYAQAVVDMSGFLASNAGGDFDLVLNGAEIAITLTTASTLSDIAKELNSETGTTGVTARVLGSNLVFETNQGAINISTVSQAGNFFGSTLGVDTVTQTYVTSAGTVQESASTLDTGATATLDMTVRAGLELRSTNGNPISVEFGENTTDAEIQSRLGVRESNSLGDGSFGTAISSISVDTASNAQKAIEVIDNALETVNGIRSELGAVNNRLDFTISNLGNVSENTSAARSRIVDADFAAETAALSRAQVLQQASQAMLAQANARPQQVLSLLQ
ncbi:A-type flagellin [Thalassocella blandensis]|nr:A-type flagellin [Thalassocella blandensis]